MYMYIHIHTYVHVYCINVFLIKSYLPACIHTHTIATYVYLVLVDFDVRTSPKERELTPLLVAASYNRKNAVLWLLQDAENKIKKDAVDSDGRNAIHLASCDLQCQYTIEVSSSILFFTQ